MPAVADPFDVVLVGGGLQNALIALALAQREPGLRVALLERDAAVGGSHTWCFHADDLAPATRAFAVPLVEFDWPGYDVVFPGERRRLDSPYAGFSAARLREVLGAAFAARGDDWVLATGAEVVAVGADRATTADGRTFRGRLIVDSRGPGGPLPRAGYQKFVGHEVRLRAPHRLERPTVMDATVPQIDGFRFFYVLPLGPDRLLVEDTRFADGPGLDVPALSAEVDAYCRARGFEVAAVERIETGVLPMPWAGRGPRPVGSPLVGGYAGGWMHPATGYSFPIAARLAELVGRLAPDRVFGPELEALARDQRRQASYGHLLNRLLFRWFRPEQRSDVFARFYRLPEARIRRFYALAMTRSDRVRLLVGRPPRGFSLRARLRSVETNHESVGLEPR